MEARGGVWSSIKRDAHNEHKWQKREIELLFIQKAAVKKREREGLGIIMYTQQQLEKKKHATKR